MFLGPSDELGWGWSGLSSLLGLGVELLSRVVGVGAWSLACPAWDGACACAAWDQREVGEGTLARAPPFPAVFPALDSWVVSVR